MNILFKRYVAVQYSGLYNMITEADSAWELAELRPVDYWYIIDNYAELKEKYPVAFEEGKKIGLEMAKKLQEQ